MEKLGMSYFDKTQQALSFPLTNDTETISEVFSRSSVWLYSAIFIFLHTMMILGIRHSRA